MFGNNKDDDDDDEAVKLKVENSTTNKSDIGGINMINNQRSADQYHAGADSTKNDLRKTSSLDDRKELTGRYE